MSPFAIVHSLIKFVLYIGLLGGLIDLTLALSVKTQSATKNGLVNLKQLNDSLLHQEQRH